MALFSWKPEAPLQEPRCDHAHPAIHPSSRISLDAKSAELPRNSLDTYHLRAQAAQCVVQLVACDSPAGRLGLTVCYDLRFPEVYQRLAFEHGAEIMLVPSAFTKATGVQTSSE